MTSFSVRNHFYCLDDCYLTTIIAILNSTFLKCMRNDFSLLISLLQSEDKAKINIFQ